MHIISEFKNLNSETGCSVMEMFYFRYRASVFDYNEKRFTKFVKSFTLAFRFLTILFPTITFGTFFYSIKLQEEYKKELAMVGSYFLNEYFKF